MEWATVIVAGMGIAGSVAAANIPARVASRLARRDRVTAVYAETLANLWTIEENAQTLSSMPGVNTERPPVGRLRQLDAEVRLLGGRAVRDQLRVAVGLANRFDSEVFLPQLRARVQASERERDPLALVEESEEGEDRRLVKEGREEIRGLQDRVALGEVADKLSRAILELEERMRRVV